MTGLTKSCFVISPIGEKGSELRSRADKVLKFLIRPALEKMGYYVNRADEIDEPGLITGQIIRRIVSDDLVVADLTGGNPNVYYELAVRHAVRKPCIQLIDSKEKIPFDVANSRTIHFDISDLFSLDEASKALEKAIERIENKDGIVENPLTQYLSLSANGQKEFTINDVIQRIETVEENLEFAMENAIESAYTNEIRVSGYDREFEQLFRLIEDMRYELALLRKG